MAWKTWKDVPVGEQNYLSTLVDVWEQTIGFSVIISPSDLLALANAGVESYLDVGQYAQKNWASRFGTVLAAMPWAAYGLTKDEYQSAASTYGTEYKKVTGQDISAAALAQAFLNPRDPTGGLLSASQYAQQLMNDAAIQKQFGWVKYGLDFTAWTQQKLQDRSLFGRDINDAEAATLLQYTRAAAGSNVAAIGRTGGQQSAPQGQTGVAGSVAR